MRLTVSGHTFEMLPLEGVLAIAQHMGFKGVDISGFHARGRIGFEPEDILADPQGQADILNAALEKYGLDCVDFFPQFGASPDQRSLNDPDENVQAHTLELVEACAQFCKLTNTPGMTILPGIDHTHRSLDENLRISGENLKKATDIAAAQGVELRFEPHMGSVAQTPERALTLVQDYAPQAKITLDYSHFMLQYIPEERIHAMIPYTGHVHLRPARPGRLQTRHADNTIDWADVIARLKSAGYAGAVSIEYVAIDWFDCNKVDTLSETIFTKEALEAHVPVT
ncbi:MAG: sugar phosphate isomerase/epimerase family protein [Anaerolineales bacterium]